MTKIKIKNLPKGFEYKDGTVVESKQSGGMLTGDQSNYGLVTTNPSMDVNNSDSTEVRYSLTKVPRDEANVEAEGGETVLADLNNDGKFGLYDIKGPRHANGGVPLYLPEQSFVFSDYNKLNFDKSESAELGIETKKKQTPAKLSRNFQLNKYYGAMTDPYADKIQVDSAELMMDKNKMKLSKLAFMQEAKKNFEDGVPYSSYPYLIQTGVDPIQFTQQVEEVSKQQAQEKFIKSLPPEQQMEIAALQSYMSQVDAAQDDQVQQDNQVQDNVSQTEMMQQEMQSAGELKNLQGGNGESTDLDTPFISTRDYPNLTRRKQIEELYRIISSGQYQDLTPGGKDLFLKTLGTTQNDPLVQEIIKNIANGDTDPNTILERMQPTPIAKPKVERKSTSRPKSNVVNQVLSDFYKERGIIYKPEGVGETEYADVQEARTKFYGDAAENIEGFYEAWKDLYPDIENLIKDLKTRGANPSPEVEKFQTWFNTTYIDDFANAWVDDYMENTDKLNEGDPDPQVRSDLVKMMKDNLRTDFGFFANVTGGRALDGKMGTVTSATRPFEVKFDKPNVVQVKKPVKDKETKQIKIEESELEVNPINRVNPEFWLQDKLKLNAIQRRKRDMFLPFQPPVKNVDFGYVLEDPTRAIAALNEQYNIGAQALGAFAGPQATSARLSGLSGKAAEQIANTIAGVNQRNVNTINRGNQIQSRFNLMLDQEERNRQTKLYDDTQATLQGFLDEKNFDREQYADAFANAVTNAAQADYLNKLNDYYQINPSTGGLISFTGLSALDPTKTKTFEEKLIEFADLSERMKNLYPDGLPASVAEKFLFGESSIGKNRAQQELEKNNPFTNFNFNNSAQSRPRKKKGGGLKKYAVPFYTGKVGL